MEATLLRGPDKEEEEAEAKSAEVVMIGGRNHRRFNDQSKCHKKCCKLGLERQ